MKNSRTIFLTAVLVLAASTGSAEEDKRTPMDAYSGDTSFWLSMCQMKFVHTTTLLEMSKPVPDDVNYVNCIREGSGDLKASLAKILKKTKKPALVAALKEYHIAIATALDGIRPGTEERKISYEQRQQALKEKVTQAWARVEIEQ